MLPKLEIEKRKKNDFYDMAVTWPGQLTNQEVV